MRLEKFHRFGEDECWSWTPDFPNNPESLVCPIVIHRDDLLRIGRDGFNGVEEKQWDV
jgi:hypothetical protein